MKKKRLFIVGLLCSLAVTLFGAFACAPKDEGCKHQAVAIEAVEATCTTPGATAGEICSKCDKVLVEPEIVPALGHDVAYSSTKTEATCTEKGTDIYAKG